MGFGLHSSLVFLDTGSASERILQHRTVTLETFPVGEHYEGVTPAHQIAAHIIVRSTGIDLFVEQFERSVGGVDNDDPLAEHGHRAYVT